MKKCLCILLSFILLSSCLAISPYALVIEKESEWFWFDALEAEYSFPEENFSVIQPVSFYSNPGGCYAFRNFLNEYQKAVYDKIIETKGGLLGKLETVTYSDGTTETVSRIEIDFPNDYLIAEANNVNAVFSPTVIGGLSAAIDDYPEYFWLGGFLCGYNYYSYADDSAHICITRIALLVTIDTASYADWNVVENCYNQLLDAVENFEITGNSRYAKLKSIHDSICNMTTYTANVPMAHQPTGVFLNGQAVCEGYAEAMKLLCDRENIPCIIVVGTGNGGAHEWNYVQMEDGKWYGVDATWDDQGTIYYDFFLVGSESLNAVFGKTKFGNGTDSDGNHINTGSFYPGTNFALTYPALSEQSYTGVIPMWNSSATFDNARKFMFIPKDAVARAQIICIYAAGADYVPSTNKASVSGVTTGGTVTVTSPVSKTYTIVRHGDVDKNNKVNSDDYNAVRNIAMHTQAEYTNSAQFAAADMNGDGVIDAFDAIYLDLYYRGLVD